MTSTLDAPETNTTPARRRRWPWILGGLAALVASAVAIAAVGLKEVWKDNTVTIHDTVSAASAADLQTVATTRVFFGHQSVGANVLSGVPAVYAAQGVSLPEILDDDSAEGISGGFIQHGTIGENEHPLRKIEDFDKIMRSGIADNVDVAAMKFCYIDVFSDTDAQDLFDRYRLMIDGLQRDYPNLRILHVTMPLMTEIGRKDKLKQEIKGILGKPVRFGQAENVVREQYNAMLRNTYGDAVFDLAAAESTAADGSRTAYTYNGDQYFTLNSAYASDPGHLNDAGATAAASAFLASIARVAR